MLQVHAQARANLQERRRFQRIPLSLPVYLMVADGTTVSAVLRDISAGGMMVGVEESLGAHHSATLRFLLGDGECAARGSILRDGRPGGIGVQFVERNRRITEFVDDISRLRGELRDPFIANLMDPRIHIA